MALKGDLASVDLAQVFQMLALNQKVGMLCISSPSGWRALYFEPRGVCLYFDEHILLDKVVLQATRSGHLTQSAAQEARRHSATHHVGLADALIAGGYLTDGEMSTMLRAEMEEEIFDLFFWTEAHFEFYEGASAIEGREGQVDTRFCFSIDTVIMEAARRIDEWSFIQERVAGPKEIFRPRGMPMNILDLEDSALALYDLVDGKRNVARLIEVTGLPGFLVYKGLAVLLDEGLIEDVPREDLIEVANECVAEGRHQDAINLFERAIAKNVGIPEAHQHAARVYEALGEFELAVYHHKCDAEFHAGAEDTRRAVEILLHAVALIPTDLAARERLVELTVGRTDLGIKEFDATKTGKALVDLYLEIGEIDRVRNILERLLRDNPFDIELKKSLVNVHTKTGETKRVIELYESIAEDLVQDRKPLEAIKFLQKVLMLDRSRKDVSERIRSLYVLDERRRNRRRSVIALCALVFVIAALGAAWWFYEQHARGQLESVVARVEKLIEAKDYDHAIEQYRGFVKEYPFTLVGREVEMEVTHIEGLRAKHQAQLDAERRSKQLDNDRIRQSYMTAWEVFQSLLRNTEMDKALRQIESIRDMVDQVGEPVDKKWAQDVGLELNLRRLKDYLGKAFDLDRRAWELLRDGEWAEARKLWLELLGDYEMSDAARTARLPVRVVSHPPGALVLRGGRPVFQAETNGSEPLRTPCVVLCDHDDADAIELKLDGFDDAKMSLTARESALREIVLIAKPSGRFKFEEPAQGAITVANGLLATALRNGRVVVASVADGSTRFVRQLPGLDEVDGRITLTSSMAIYLTRDGNIAAQSLATGRVAWTSRPAQRPMFAPIIHSNRLVFVDERNRLIAMDANSGGDPLWWYPLDEAPVAAPVLDGRILRIATRGGHLHNFDVVEGDVVDRIDLGARLATGVVPHLRALIAGTEDGRLIAVDATTHKLLWSHTLPTGSLAERVVPLEGRILVLANGGRLSLHSARDGQLEASTVIDGEVLSGPEVGEGRLFVTLRQKVGRDSKLDVLVALDQRALAVLWEYRDGAPFSTPVTAFGAEALIGSGSGEILRFR